MTRCPYCNSEISKEATQCEICGESLETQCPYCKEIININDKICPFCEGKLKKNPLSVIVKIIYILLFINAMIPFWLGNSIIDQPVFWHGMVEKSKDYNDLISAIINFALLSSVPSIVGILTNYRKRLCIISVFIFVLFSICNLYLVANIR